MVIYERPTTGQFRSFSVEADHSLSNQQHFSVGLNVAGQIWLLNLVVYSSIFLWCLYFSSLQEQYRFIFDLMLMFLESFSIYSNFKWLSCPCKSLFVVNTHRVAAVLHYIGVYLGSFCTVSLIIAYLVCFCVLSNALINIIVSHSWDTWENCIGALIMGVIILPIIPPLRADLVSTITIKDLKTSCKFWTNSKQPTVSLVGLIIIYFAKAPQHKNLGIWLPSNRTVGN